MGTTGAKQHGGDPVFSSLSHDEVGSPSSIAGYSTEDFLSPDRPAVRAMHICLEAALIKINNIVPAMFGNPSPQMLEI